MSILDQARLDIQAILSGGFSSEITMISPDSQEATFRGIHTKHHLGINPSTGERISSKKASVSISEAELIAANADYPIRCNEEVTFKKHLVKVQDSTGVEKTYRCEQWYPDETVGLITIILGTYAD